MTLQEAIIARHSVRNYIAMICKKGDDVNLGAETFRHFCQLRTH